MRDLGTKELLRLARMFHVHEMPVGETYHETPEAKRYQEMWATALAKHSEWKAIVGRLRPKLPNAQVSDTTAPTGSTARRCCIYMKQLPYAEQKEPYST